MEWLSNLAGDVEQLAFKMLLLMLLLTLLVVVTTVLVVYHKYQALPFLSKLLISVIVVLVVATVAFIIGLLTETQVITWFVELQQGAERIWTGYRAWVVARPWVGPLAVAAMALVCLTNNSLDRIGEDDGELDLAA